jgi:hypothetical protein
MGLLRSIEARIRRKFLEWLLKDRCIKIGDSIIITDSYIDLALLSVDPSMSSGRLWWRDDLKNLYISDGERSISIFPPLKACIPGRFYGAFDTATALTTLAISANVLYAAPFFVPVRMKFDQIAINVTGAGASGTRARMGVYTDGNTPSTQGYPSSLVPGTDVAEVAVDSTGVKANSISVTLPPGLYWLALVSSGAPTVRAVGVASLDSEILGLGSDLGTAPGVGYSVSYTYGSLPSTFPTGASVYTSTIPLVALRRA